MIQLSSTLAIVAGELFAIVLLAALVLGYRLASRRRVDRRAALAVAQDIKEGLPTRLESLRRSLAEDLGYSGEALDEGAQGLSRRERFLYQRILNLYAKRDAIALRQITIDVENHTAACLGLLPEIAEASVPGDGGDPGEAGTDSKVEVETLRQENQRIKDELRITMETMARMLDEYSNMFDDEAPNGETGDVLDDGLGEMEVGETVEEVAFGDEGPGGEVIETNTASLKEAAEAGELRVEEAALAEMEEPASVLDAATWAASEIPDPALEREPEAQPEPAAAADHEAEELDDIWAEALAEQDQEEAEGAK